VPGFSVNYGLFFVIARVGLAYFCNCHFILRAVPKRGGEKQF